MKALLILIMMLISMILIANDKTSDWIDLEWDEVANAKGYDIELSELIDGKSYPRGVFHTTTSRWSQESKPGKYQIRIRAVDQRKVPGEWGEFIPVTVKLAQVQMVKPFQNEVFISNDLEEITVHFQWIPSPGAKFYQFVLLDDANKILKEEILSQTEIQHKIADIKNYKWVVLPLFLEKEKKPVAELINEKTVTFKNFSLKGEMLKFPVVEVEIIKNKGFIFKWDEVFRAKDYYYEIFQEIDAGKLKSLFKGSTKNKNKLVIPKEKMPEGKYIVAIKATAEEFKDSEYSKVIVKTSLRDLTLISNESLSKNFFKRPADASSIVMGFSFPNFNYTSIHFETDTKSEFKLRGLRIEGTWKSNVALNRYQNVLHFDLAQVSDSSVDGNFYSVGDSIGKTKIFKNSRLFYGVGVQLESTPVIYADRLNNTILNKSFNTIGPELTLQYSYRLFEHFSMEALARIYLGILGTAVEGAKFKPGINHLADLKFIYMMNEKFDFFAGFSRIEKLIKSKAQLGETSLAVAGDENEIKVSTTSAVFGAEFFY